MALKNVLEKKLTKRQLGLMPKSFDVIGNKDKAVAIIEIPEELKNKKRLIAEALMAQHKNVKTVLEKKSKRKGVYRIRDYKILAGSKDTEVIHVESGCRFMLDPMKVYFSQREGTERMRIAEKTGKREKVMVFFAGAGPFAIIIAKKANPNKIIGIEINPDAVKYFMKNIVLNKAENIVVVYGDVKERARNFYGYCDRVLMPLPESSFEFLEEAMRCLKKGGICHYYRFLTEEGFSREKELIRKTAKKIRRVARFKGFQKVLPYGPGIWKMRIDFAVM